MSDAIGYIRVILPRYPDGGQRKAMTEHGIDKIIQEGGKKPNGTRSDLLRMRAPGRVIAIQHLFLLADPKAKRKRGGTRKDLWKAIDAWEADGGIFWELSTGLRSDNRRQRDEMTREAVEALARGRHKTDRGDKRGRPKKEFDDTTKAKGKAVWESRKYKTWDEAAERLPAGMTVWDAYALWGKRGAD